MKIGFVSAPFSGHLIPMHALAHKMKLHGHHIVFIGIPDVEPFAQAAGVEFVPYCEDKYPRGSFAKLISSVSKMQGLDVIRWSVREFSTDFFLATSERLPQKLSENGVEALVIDTIHSFIELVPMSLGMPYAHVWNVLNIDFSGVTPACFFSWPYENTEAALARNLEGGKVAAALFEPVMSAAMAYAEKAGLKIDWATPGVTMSKLAIVSQTPKEFDFPGIPWPPSFQYAGPFFDTEAREPVPFPWDRLTGQPLIYASLGTLVNGLTYVYKAILQVAANLPENQVVLSIGENIEMEDLGEIPSNVVVVRKAPQIELLKRAVLCITHAGLNTALESLGQGVPMVALPIAYDQPGVAARIAHHHVGEYLELEDITVERLQALVQKVKNEPAYREKARYFQKVITRGRGLDLAAETIERAFETELTGDRRDTQPAVAALTR